VTGELLASTCCGAVFTPGMGPDNIYEEDTGVYDAVRWGDCPACGTSDSTMIEVRGFRE